MIQCPKSETEAIQLRNALDEDRSVWGNMATDSSPLARDSKEIGTSDKDSNFFGSNEEGQAALIDDMKYEKLKAQRSMNIGMLESQRRELTEMSPSQVAE